MVPDAAELERLYAYPDAGRPWVRTNFVSTLDGAAYDEEGRSGSLGGPVDSRVFRVLRSLADVIVVGAGTARTEGYRPVEPHEIDGALRQRLGMSPVPPIAVVSRRLHIPDALVSAGQLAITTADATPATLESLRETIDVIAVGAGEVDWKAVTNDLADRGLTRVLCEGGPMLHGHLAALDLIDELCLTIAPVIAAGSASRIAHGHEAFRHDMTLAHIFDADGVLITRWLRSRQ